MIQSYYGNGKGKTTAAVGSAIRCAGNGHRVLFIQLLKNNDSGEFKILKDILGIDIMFSNERYELYDNKNAERFAVLREAYSKLLFKDLPKDIDSYQMIIMDEILDAIEFGYISMDKLTELVNKLREHSEIIMTGHILPKELALISDYISEIKEVKHPYTKGAVSRKGIEY